MLILSLGGISGGVGTVAIRAEKYSRDVLSADEEEYLFKACDWLIDHFIEDLSNLLHRRRSKIQFSDTLMFEYLPPAYIHGYDAVFAKRFFTCLMTVVWKLRSPNVEALACVVEELALSAIIRCAQTLMEMDDKKVADFTAFEHEAFEDTDFMMLWDQSKDGIEKDEIGRMMGIANLGCQLEWGIPACRPCCLGMGLRL